MAQKAIYIMTFSALWGTVVDHLSEAHDIEPALYIGMQRPQLEGSALEHAPFYHVDAARRASVPQGLDGFEKAVLDPEYLRNMAAGQAIVSEMLSRFLMGKKDGTFEKRRQYMWELYRIWEGIFDALDPDMVIAGSMPHRVFDYVVYLICERRGIPFVALDITSLPHLVYACTSVHDQSKSFDDALFKKRNLPPLSDKTQEFLNYVADPPEDYRPANFSLTGLFKSHDMGQKKSLKNMLLEKLPELVQIPLLAGKLLMAGKLYQPLESLFNFEGDEVFSGEVSRAARKSQHLKLGLKAGWAVRRAEQWYKAHIEGLDETKPYIYFPANFMPERSTVPDSGYFYDYFLIFSMLERSIPDDWQIVYKEHPRSFFKPIAYDNPRDIDFFLRLKEACPRLKFIDPKTNSKRLIKHCRAVAIASGTTGWEAMARGVPVLLFGEYWYGRAKGVFRVETLEALRAAVDFIVSGPVLSREDVQAYLQKVESVSSDLGYYYIDNIEERMRMGTGQDRVFTEEELEFRAKFSVKMAGFLADHVKARAA